MLLSPLRIAAAAALVGGALATTITNVFEANPPTPTPTPEPPAALPVAVAPTFTG